MSFSRIGDVGPSEWEIGRWDTYKCMLVLFSTTPRSAETMPTPHDDYHVFGERRTGGPVQKAPQRAQQPESSMTPPTLSSSVSC